MFIRYAAQFYSNFGNYSSYGKSKIVPELSQEKFEEILQSSTCFADVKYIWDCVKDIVYDESLEYKTINLIENKGKNSFYLGEIKIENILEIDNFLKDNDTDLCNTRLVMINPHKFCYLVASVEERIEDLGENNRIIGYYGEFRAFLKRVNECLENAKKFCYNDLQGKVIDNYMECFRTGDIKKHFDSQINWIKDKKPNVEFNLGWMNNLIDPLRNRCTFEVIYLII
jgi:dipeptidyl-peptidase-3